MRMKPPEMDAIRTLDCHRLHHRGSNGRAGFYTMLFLSIRYAERNVGEQHGVADSHVEELARTDRKTLGRRPRQLELVARVLLLCSGHLLAKQYLCWEVP